MIKEFKEIGFSEKEAKIYLLLVKDGELSAPKIAKTLGIERRTVYDIIETLFKKGWVSKKQIHNNHIYSITNPELIEDDIYEKYKSFKKIVPRLKNLKKDKTYPSINILYGKNAVKTLMLNLFKTKKNVSLMGRGGYLLEQLGDSKFQYIPKLKKLKLRMIQTKEFKDKLFELGQIRYFPKGAKFDTAFLTFSDYVYLFAKYEDIVLIEIKDKNFAKTYKTYFEYFWKISKEK